MTSVRFQEWESLSEFRAHFVASRHRALVVGEAACSPNYFYSCVVESGRGPTEVGVIASGHGIVPAAVALDKGRVLVVGHDTWLTWVNLDRPAHEGDRRLEGVFYEFIPVNDTELVVLHELGVIRIDSQGGVAWNVHTEVIESCTVDASGNLVLGIMEADSPIIVEIESGRTRR